LGPLRYAGFQLLLDIWIDTLGGFLDQFGLETVDLFAMSLGSWVCALYAHANPHRIRRLVLLDAPGLNPRPPIRVENFTLPSRESIGRNYAPALADQIYEEMSQPGREAAYTEMLKYINDPAVREEWSMRDRLPQMIMPILFTNVDTNRGVPPEYSFEGFRLAPHSRLMVTVGGFGKGGFPEQVEMGVEFLNAEKIPPAR
jgi:pimeloyl-ACP methyl ester carboxylesterase